MEEKIIEKDSKIKSAEIYEIKYNKLFKQVMSVFGKWSRKLKIPIYSKQIKMKIREVQEDGDSSISSRMESVKVNPNYDSIDGLFGIIDKIIDIVEAPPIKQQKVLRRVIVQAKMLERHHFLKDVNDTYSPEKVYEKVDKLLFAQKHRIDTLNLQIKGLKAKNNNLESRV